MARVELAPGVLDDFERILDHLAGYDVPDLSSRITALLDALAILSGNPDIGRPVRGGKRELVIGRGAHGYVALYRHVAPIGVVFVLAVRSQREAGYPRDA